MNTYRFYAFRAIDNRSECDRFEEGHVSVLKAFGIESITTNNSIWKFDPNVWVIMVEEVETGILVGGIRVQKFDGRNELPMVKAIQHLDGRIAREVMAVHEGGTGECCGMWVSRRAFGKGVAPLLCRASVTIADQCGVQTLFCLVAHYTLEMVKDIGFKVMTHLGNEGHFQYPDERYKAYAMKYDDIFDFSNAIPKEQERYKSLRNQPIQTSLELSQGKELTVHYNFKLT
jgi:hypothetical protein